jgi:hypothetical protein
MRSQGAWRSSGREAVPPCCQRSPQTSGLNVGAVMAFADVAVAGLPAQSDLASREFGWDLKRAGCCGMWGTRIAALRVRLSRRSPRADEMTPARGLEPLAVYIITLFFRCHLHPKPDELAGGVALWLARDVGKQVLIAVFSHQLCVARAHPGRTGI